ncbi:MAG: hypothetical protein AB1918_07365, partial [Pseudomonadota bacterium]
PKVKPEGFILGHDYCSHTKARQMGFGVVEAVNHFVLTKGYDFLALSGEIFPTFVLAKSGASPPARDFLLKLMLNTAVVEIRDFPRVRLFAQHLIERDGGVRPIPSF